MTKTAKILMVFTFALIASLPAMAQRCCAIPGSTFGGGGSVATNVATDGSQFESTAASHTITLGTTIPSGSIAFVVGIDAGNNGSFLPAPTDSGSNTWTCDQHANSGSSTIIICSAFASASISTITVHPSTSGTEFYFFYANKGTATPADVGGSAGATSSALTVTASGPVTATDVVMAAFVVQDSSDPSLTLDAGGSYTMLVIDSNPLTSRWVCVGWKEVASGTPSAKSSQGGASLSTNGVLEAYKE